MDIQQLEKIYCCSPNWVENPAFSVGDRVYCRPLGLNLVIKGILHTQGEWIYYVKHNGCFKKFLGFQLVATGNYSILATNKFRLGQVVEFRFNSQEKQSVIYGLVFDGGWRYFLSPKANEFICVEESMLLAGKEVSDV